MPVLLRLIATYPVLVAVLCFIAATTAGQTRPPEGDSLVVLIYENSELTRDTSIIKNGFHAYRQGLTNEYFQIGYLATTNKTRQISSDSIEIFYTTGAEFKYQTFRWTDSNVIPIDRPYRQSKEELISYLDDVVDYYENRGHPFATAAVDVVELRDSIAIGRLIVEKGPLIRLDSIAVISDDKIHLNSLQHYLGILVGDLYNEEKLRLVDSFLNEIPFIKVNRPSQVSFYKDGAVLYLYIEKKRSGFFNGIVGFLPNSETGQLLITGELDLKLNNSLNRSETIGLRWRKLQNQTQDFDLKFAYPFIAGKPLGLDSELDIFRRDSTFTNLHWNIGLLVQQGPNQYVKGFVERRQSNQIKSTSLISGTGDANATQYGLEFGIRHKFDQLNPRKGYSALLRGATGTRSIVTEAEAPVLKSNTFDTDIMLESALEILPSLVIYNKIEVSGYWSETPLFTNELDRVGGLKVLRGFDEESLFADRFAVGTFELRYLYSRYGFFRLFFDQGWLSTRTVSTNTSDSPFGFGAGIQLETGAGIFVMNYALGRQANNPLLLRNAKIHFGFVSQF